MIINILIDIILLLALFILFVFYTSYLLSVCWNRYTNKKTYSKKEFLKDLFIPFRLWYITFYKLFNEN